MLILSVSFPLPILSYSFFSMIELHIFTPVVLRETEIGRTDVPPVCPISGLNFVGYFSVYSIWLVLCVGTDIFKNLSFQDRTIYMRVLSYRYTCFRITLISLNLLLQIIVDIDVDVFYAGTHDHYIGILMTRIVMHVMHWYTARLPRGTKVTYTYTLGVSSTKNMQ